jgi:hypothetical protein
MPGPVVVLEDGQPGNVKSIPFPATRTPYAQDVTIQCALNMGRVSVADDRVTFAVLVPRQGAVGRGAVRRIIDWQSVFGRLEFRVVRVHTRK